MRWSAFSFSCWAFETDLANWPVFRCVSSQLVPVGVPLSPKQIRQVMVLSISRTFSFMSRKQFNSVALRVSLFTVAFLSVFFVGFIFKTNSTSSSSYFRILSRSWENWKKFFFLNIRHLDCLGKETSAGLSVKFNNPLHGFGGPMNNDFLIQPNDQWLYFWSKT